MAQLLKTLPVQRFEGHAVFFKSADVATETDVRTIQGFASMRGLDRDWDDIDPSLFDIEKFMENPQVYVNHALWKDDNGNEVNAGLVTDMRVAYAVKSESPGNIDIIDIDTKAIIASVSEEDRVATPGDYGLWVSADIVEKGVIEQVDAGRLGAFSWRGDLVYKGSRDVIDLMEVSLVNVPAHPNALFVIKKSFSLDSTNVVLGEDGSIKSIGSDDKTAALSGPLVDAAKAFPFAVLSKRATGEQSMLPLRKYTSQAEAEEHVDQLIDGNSELSHILLLKHTQKMFDGGVVYEVIKTRTRVRSESTMWTKGYIDTLPDCAFAHIGSGGVLDANGLTTPRALRQFPLANHKGVLSADRVKEALDTVKTYPLSSSVRHAVVSAAVELGVLSKSDGELPDDVDKALLGADTDAGANNNVEGGEVGMGMTDEQFKSLSDNVAELGTRFTALETMLKTKEAEEDVKEDDETSSNDVSKEKTADDSGTDDQYEKLLGLITTVAEQVPAMAKRIESLETLPMKSKQANESDQDDEEARTLKKSKEMSPEDRTKCLDSFMTELLTTPPR